ncbi:MAG: hypothetical protein MUF58_02485 [Arcicella sp.]|nr:hypothetical protein [Arcicella sp.]
MKVKERYKFLLVIVLVNIFLLIIFLITNSDYCRELIKKVSGSQGIILLSIIGAYIRRNFSEDKKDSLNEYFWNTNFLTNAKFGIIIVGIPLFIIWVFFIR